MAAALAKSRDSVTAFPSIKSSVSRTPQRLILTGTIVGRSAHEGTAFIGVDAHNPQTYSGGAILANGVRLEEIYKDHVVLAKGGQRVSLYLQQAKGGAGRQADDLLMVGGPMVATPAVATSSEPFTDFIRPSPVYDGANLRGIEVYPGRQAGVFDQLGLRGGDVITAIDGQPFGDAAQAMELFRQLASGVAMTATITRKGQAQSIALDGALIVTAQQRAHEAAIPSAGTRPPPPG